MLNGAFVRDAANEWAEKIRTDSILSSIEAKIEAFFKDAYAREPSEVEHAQLMNYYKSNSDPDAALKDIAFILLNTKEFIYVY